MERLFKKMQEYICEQILNDDGAAEHLRQVSDWEELTSSVELKVRPFDLCRDSMSGFVLIDSHHPLPAD